MDNSFNYTKSKNQLVFTISNEIYPVICLEKAVANFLDNAYISFEKTEQSIVIKMVKLNSEFSDEEIIGEFYNELLREVIRYNVLNETKTIRELIVGRSLYSTCINTENNNNQIKQEKLETENSSLDQEYNINDLAINWFDKNRE